MDDDDDVEDLFDPRLLARRTDPWTSDAAADKVRKFGGGHEQKILAALYGADRLASQQISERIDVDYIGVARRMAALVRAGLVESTESVHVNRSECEAKKWRMTDAARGVWDRAEGVKPNGEAPADSEDPEGPARWES